MAWERVGRTLVVVHNEQPPDSDEFNAYVAMLEAQGTTLSGYIVYTAGGAPNVIQRKQAIAVWARVEHIPPFAVITTSALTRGVVTALSWVLKGKFVTFVELDEAAFQHACVPPNEHEAVRSCIQRLELSLSTKMT